MAKIGRNELCWCGSGKKYKHCHLNRQFEQRLPFEAIRAKINDASAFQVCLHPEASRTNCGKVISAHTLQRSRVLRAIESNDHHVLSFYPMELDAFGEFKVHRRGWKQASTFRAFCEKHDGELFEPLEANPFQGSKEEIFLIGYRAVCWELYQKQRGLLPRETMSNLLDRVAPQQLQKLVQHQLSVQDAGVAKGYRDAERVKTQMDEAILRHDYQRYETVRLKFQGRFSVGATGAITPNRTFDGTSIQILHDTNAEIEWLPFGVDIESDGFSVVFVFRKDFSAVERYMRSILALSNPDLEVFLPQFFFAHCENTYFSEDWWNALTQIDQAFARKLMANSNPYYYPPEYDLSIKLADWTLIARQSA